MNVQLRICLNECATRIEAKSFVRGIYKGIQTVRRRIKGIIRLEFNCTIHIGPVFEAGAKA